jgi:hypothetical protein
MKPCCCSISGGVSVRQSTVRSWAEDCRFDTGTIEGIEAGSILMHNGDGDAFLHMPLHSVHEFRYCDPRELDEPEAEERFAGFLIMRLIDGNVLQFAEPK